MRLQSGRPSFGRLPVQDEPSVSYHHGAPGWPPELGRRNELAGRSVGMNMEIASGFFSRSQAAVWQASWPAGWLARPSKLSTWNLLALMAPSRSALMKCAKEAREDHPRVTQERRQLSDNCYAQWHLQVSSADLAADLSEPDSIRWIPISATCQPKIRCSTLSVGCDLAGRACMAVARLAGWLYVTFIALA